jgi:hypothetical protein
MGHAFQPSYIYRLSLPVLDLIIVQASTTHCERLRIGTQPVLPEQPCKLNLPWLSEQGNPSSSREQLDCTSRSPRELSVGT